METVVLFILAVLVGVFVFLAGFAAGGMTSQDWRELRSGEKKWWEL